jgi:hypothetical protein
MAHCPRSGRRQTFRKPQRLRSCCSSAGRRLTRLRRRPLQRRHRRRLWIPAKKFAEVKNKNVLEQDVGSFIASGLDWSA